MKAGAVYRFARRCYDCYSADHGSSFAAAIAYYTLFSIFPLSVFLLWFASYFVSTSQRDELVNKLTSALGGASTANVSQQVNALNQGKAGIGVIGLLGALWSATAVFSQVRTGLSVVWNYQSPHSWLRQKARDLMGVFGMAVVLVLSVAATSAVTFVSTLAAGLAGRRTASLVTVPLGIMLTLLPLVIVFLALGLLYVLASPPRIGWRHVWPGAFFASAGFVVLTLFFSIYVRQFGHFNKVYGSIGVVIAFLFFAYLVGSLVLLGGEVTEQYVRYRRAGGEPATDACDTEAGLPPAC